MLALRIEAERHGLDEQAARRRHEHGEQRWLEGQQAAAIGGGAFGEDGDRLALGERLAQRIDLATYRVTLGARDKDSIVEPGQPADDGPAFDLVLRDKGCAGEAAEDGYIDPADVIGDVENIMDERSADAGDADAEDARCGSKEAARPRRWLGGERIGGHADGKGGEKRTDARSKAHGPDGILKDCAQRPHAFCASRAADWRQVGFACALGALGMENAQPDSDF